MNKKASRKRTKPRVAGAKRRPTATAAELRMTVRMVEAASPYAEVSIHEPVTEHSMERIFESVRGELLRHRPRRVLVDLRDAPVQLSISDKNGLVKLIAGSFAGAVERMAMVLRPVDVPEEKFLEPSLIHRGLPTLITSDVDDAIGWLTAKLLRPR